MGLLISCITDRNTNETDNIISEPNKTKNTLSDDDIIYEVIAPIYYHN